MKLINRDGTPIASWAEWTRPKQDYQWQEGRSALELAKAWFRAQAPECPQELQSLFQTASFLPDLILLEGRPEFVTPLPMAGEGRNHDLHLLARSADGPISICIEAKADEPFGATIQDTIVEARHKKPATGVPRRARRLIKLLTGVEADPEREPWSGLRYQLLTGLAGAALQAKRDGARIALFIMHEFVSDKTRDDLHERNTLDLAAFLRVLASEAPEFQPHQFWGPLRTATEPAVELYVAKVVTNLRA
jgi:hypothetical protein